MERFRIIPDLNLSTGESDVRERHFHALTRLRAQLAELEARCEGDALLSEAVSSVLEAQREQLAALLASYEKIQAGSGASREPHPLRGRS